MLTDNKRPLKLSAREPIKMIQ